VTVVTSLTLRTPGQLHFMQQETQTCSAPSLHHPAAEGTPCSGAESAHALDLERHPDRTASSPGGEQPLRHLRVEEHAVAAVCLRGVEKGGEWRWAEATDSISRARKGATRWRLDTYRWGTGVRFWGVILPRFGRGASILCSGTSGGAVPPNLVG
jgi:hypothetical protein